LPSFAWSEDNGGNTDNVGKKKKGKKEMRSTSGFHSKKQKAIIQRQRMEKAVESKQCLLRKDVSFEKESFGPKSFLLSSCSKCSTYRCGQPSTVLYEGPPRLLVLQAPAPPAPFLPPARGKGRPRCAGGRGVRDLQTLRTLGTCWDLNVHIQSQELGVHTHTWACA